MSELIRLNLPDEDPIPVMPFVPVEVPTLAADTGPWAREDGHGSEHVNHPEKRPAMQGSPCGRSRRIAEAGVVAVNRYDRYAQIFENPVTDFEIELGNRVLHWLFMENLADYVGHGVIAQHTRDADRRNTGDPARYRA